MVISNIFIIKWNTSKPGLTVSSFVLYFFIKLNVILTSKLLGFSIKKIERMDVMNSEINKIFYSST